MTELPAKEISTTQSCVSCGTPLAGKFCHVCGEKAFDAHDHSLRHFAEELLHTLTHFDSKFLKSLQHLFFKPGTLTNTYLAGRKKLFTKPLALFVVSNVLFFLLQPLVNINSFNSTLRMQTALHGKWVNVLVEQEIAEREISFEVYEKLYDAKSEQWAKSLIIVQIPLLALLSSILYLKQRRFFFDHLIFATHFYSFMLWVNIAFTLGIYCYRKLGGQVYNLEVPLFMLTGIYFMVAAREVYRPSRTLAVINGVLLTGCFALTLVAYRVLLFFATYISL